MVSFGKLLSQPATGATCGLVGDSQPGEQLNGCPAEIPVLDKENQIIVAARIYDTAGWNYAGTDITELSCVGTCQDIEAETKFTGPNGDAFIMGSVIINPGCTMIVFQEYNYLGGEIKRFDSGVHPTIAIEAPLQDCGSVACARSMLFTCKQVFPVCTPKSYWQTVTTLDNSEATVDSHFSYKKTVGELDNKNAPHKG